MAFTELYRAGSEPVTHVMQADAVEVGASAGAISGIIDIAQVGALLLARKHARVAGDARKARQYVRRRRCQRHGHIETVHYGPRGRRETAPYTHRLGEIRFVEDGSRIAFADLVSRSRYTGGLYGSATKRRRSLLRATVWMDPKEGPSGVHVGIDVGDRQGKCWLIEDARLAGVPLLGPEENPYGAVFPRRDYDRGGEPDLLPVFHYEDWGRMSVCEAMPNGDRLSELMKPYGTVRECSGGEHSKRVCELRASGRYGRYIRLTGTGRPVIDRAKIKAAERMDGKLVVHSNDDTLSGEDMALGYKQLQRVELAWRQLKTGLRLRPVYHRAVHRIHAHIALTVIALLLERMAEHSCADTWRNIPDDLKGIQLAQLIGSNGTLWQVTEPRPSESNSLKSLQINPPPAILKLA